VLFDGYYSASKIAPSFSYTKTGLGQHDDLFIVSANGYDTGYRLEIKYYSAAIGGPGDEMEVLVRSLTAKVVGGISAPTATMATSSFEDTTYSLTFTSHTYTISNPNLSAAKCWIKGYGDAAGTYIGQIAAKGSMTYEDGLADTVDNGGENYSLASPVRISIETTDAPGAYRTTSITF
jgi:hypothetical protein